MRSEPGKLGNIAGSSTGKMAAQLQLQWDFEETLQHFQRKDKRVADLLHGLGPRAFFIQPDPFASLVHAVLSQQISTRAAETIHRRVKELFGGVITPHLLATTTPEVLRECGISGRKAGYLQDLSTRFADSRSVLHRLHELEDDEVVEALVEIKGIGEWTAQMCLIFSLGRMDVFAPNDFGLMKAMMLLYKKKNKPDAEWFIRTASRWAPYRSIASRYLWLSLSEHTATVKG